VLPIPANNESRSPEAAANAALEKSAASETAIEVASDTLNEPPKANGFASFTNNSVEGWYYSKRKITPNPDMENFFIRS
jgi:hypothetical protein